MVNIRKTSIVPILSSLKLNFKKNLNLKALCSRAEWFSKTKTTVPIGYSTIRFCMVMHLTVISTPILKLELICKRLLSYSTKKNKLSKLSAQCQKVALSHKEKLKTTINVLTSWEVAILVDLDLKTMMIKWRSKETVHSIGTLRLLFYSR